MEQLYIMVVYTDSKDKDIDEEMILNSEDVSEMVERYILLRRTFCVYHAIQVLEYSPTHGLPI